MKTISIVVDANCIFIIKKNLTTTMIMIAFCEDCFHNSYTYCYNCDDAVRNSNSHYSEITGNDYCESCFYDYHGYCERCEDNYWLEDGCNCSSHIHRYSYKPNPIFFKTQKEKPNST